jgi:Flp pilus assembly protein TadB
MYAGDADREHAAGRLKDHYVRGRLTADELADRTARVLAARSRADLRRAFRDLPLLPNPRELGAEWRETARAAARGAMLVAFTGAYLLFCFALVLVFLVTLIVHGASLPTLLGFLAVWLVPTYALSRLWHRRPPVTRRRT